MLGSGTKRSWLQDSSVFALHMTSMSFQNDKLKAESMKLRFQILIEHFIVEFAKSTKKAKKT